MAILTKAQLEALNQSSFPDNITGAITPQILRDYNTATIDTLVDSLDTGSFVQDLTSLNSFTQSQEAKDSTLASYTGSVNTKFDTIGSQSGSWVNVPLTSLNAFTASQEQKDSTLATYTGSVDSKFSTIGTQSGSWDNTLLNQFTASQETKNTTLGGVTASLQQQLTNIGSQSGSWDNTNLNAFSASQITKDSTLATYTGSIDTKFSTLGSQSGSWITESETGSMSVNFAVTASKAQDLYVNAKNTSGATITKGSIVKITGASGDNPEIGLADWTNDGTSANTLGITTEDIAINAFSDIVVQGRVIGLNTNGFTAGQLIFLGPNGTIVASVPTPYHEVRLGQVLRSNINQGSIYLSIDNGYELTELHDVNIVTASLANNDLLAYDSVSQQWTNKTTSQLGIATTGSNTFTGTNSFQTITAVSASFQYVQSITGSSVNIGESFIVLNNDTPVQRYAGIIVQDSGSVLTTASLQFDGESNDWFYEYSTDGGVTTDNAVALFGPEYNTKGSPSYLTANRLPKSDGTHHLNDSSIYDDGTNVSIGKNTTVTGSITSNNTITSTKSGGNGLVLSNSGISSAGTIVGYNNIQSLGQYAGINLQANTQGSGSQYPGVNIIVAPNTYPTDIFGGFSILTEQGALAGSTFLGLASSTYTPQYGGTNVPTLIANGNNPAGNDTAMIWKSDGTAEHWKKSDFKYGISVTGSTEVGSFTSSLQQGYAFVGGANGKTITVATSSFIDAIPLTSLNAFTQSQEQKDTTLGSQSGSWNQAYNSTLALNTYTQSNDAKWNTLGSVTGSYATTGSNAFVGTQTINGNVFITGSTNISGSTTTITGRFNVNTPLASNESQIDFIKLPTFVGANGTTYPNATFSLGDYASSGIDQTFWIEFANASFEKYSALLVGPSRTQFIVGTGTGYDYDVIELLDNNNNTTTAKVKADTVILQGAIQATGSLSVSGSINTSVIPLTITSNTASLNASTGNTFQLNLVSGSQTRLEISGTRSGQTINLLVSQSATGPGTLVFGSGIVQPSGSFYSASQVASAEDILTMATFVNPSKIYVANIKNLI